MSFVYLHFKDSSPVGHKQHVCQASAMHTNEYVKIMTCLAETKENKRIQSSNVRQLSPVDLKTRKSTGTSRQIEIHFSIQIIKFLMKYRLIISGRLIIFFIKDSY